MPDPSPDPAPPDPASRAPLWTPPREPRLWRGGILGGQGLKEHTHTHTPHAAGNRRGIHSAHGPICPRPRSRKHLEERVANDDEQIHDNDRQQRRERKAAAVNEDGVDDTVEEVALLDD